VTDAAARAQPRTPDMARLDGRVAVVTGAAGKLGPTWCAALAEAGATVIGVDLAAAGSPPEGVESLAVADVTDRASVEAVLDEVAGSVGVPGVLVNGAGIDQPPDPQARTYRVEDIPVEQFRGTLDVNLVGAFQAIQVFGAAMRDAGGGSIVNIGSLYATVAPRPELYDHLDADPPFLKPPAYGASKAGLVALTRYFARLWGPHGVRVNTLSPGGVRGGQDEQFTAKYCAHVPLGRMAEPQDLAAPLVFLASDASRYVTGQELRVDGGFTA
jgi:NAD(P)-dependent dehydrogenase (short-subunit alcohol dehydrogenase family)